MKKLVPYWSETHSMFDDLFDRRTHKTHQSRQGWWADGKDGRKYVGPTTGWYAAPPFDENDDDGLGA